MLKIKFYILLILISALFAAAQTTNTAPQGSQLDPTAYGVVLDTPATKNVTVKRDITYFTSPAGAQTIDVYTPPGSKKRPKAPGRYISQRHRRPARQQGQELGDLQFMAEAGGRPWDGRDIDGRRRRAHPGEPSRAIRFSGKGGGKAWDRCRPARCLRGIGKRHAIVHLSAR